MKILAIETSAVTCSVAFYDGDKITEEFVDNGLNHSRTLMPLIDGVLKSAGAAPQDVDLFACAAGPGSFTGIRIGVAAVKGMASAADKLCAGVSTLEGMAMSAPAENGLICCVMDARRGQFYNALFEKNGETLTRFTDDAAEPGEVIAERIANAGRPVLLMGDGAAAFSRFTEGLAVTVPEGDAVYQRASGVIRAVLEAGEETFVTPQALAPKYLRLSQAEREYAEKQKDKKDGTK